MRTFFTGIILLAFAQAGVAEVSKPDPASVKALSKKVADWQIRTFDEHGKYRALPGKYMARIRETGKTPGNYHDLVWHMGALYAGMDQWRTIADDSTPYNDFLYMIGSRNGWKLHRAPYFADDHAVGHFYLSFYTDFNDPAMLKPTRERFDWILANPKTGSMEWTSWEERHKTDCRDRWGWCDALFMAPPVWARLAKITGEKKYLDFMDREYHATYDLLWDTEDRFFWRDTSFFSKREKNGRKLYWARGNGWVFGGLALMIPDLPEDWEGRGFYIELFKQMAESLKNCQRDDGTWSMGLLGGVEGYPVKETSGTSFFTFGFAWGINNGLLDRAVYEPIVFKAWDALAECVTEEGLLGYVQPVGAAPGDAYPDKTEVYGVGAFLAAGSEVYKLAGGAPNPAEPRLSRPAKDAQAFTLFMENGGWCWYQDPRAIIHDGRLFIGSVKGNGDGEALVGVYDLRAEKQLGSVVVNPKYDHDDHNSPVFYARPDGSVLAMYARHSVDRKHSYRISDPKDPMKWSEEMVFVHDYPGAGNVTYMNLFEMKDEGKLYNFFRGIKFNPSFITSTNHGKTWGDPTHFISSELKGRHRPYARYAGNGKDTVYVSFTDGHPRQFGNSIYYAEFRDGKYLKADGSELKDPAKDGPLRPSEAELVYKGSDKPGRGGDLSAIGSAWTSSMKVDSGGHPHIGYTLYLSNTDHRYRIASWDGKKWHDREVAYAGTCLYDRESSYTGLITMDPIDPSIVFISTDVDPVTGKDLGGTHEIYRAKVGLEDTVASIQWEAVTKYSKVRNIRPMVLRDGRTRVVLWNRGEYKTYTDYDLDAVGFVEVVK